MLALTETWLDPSIPDSYLDLPDFQIFRRDRVRKRVGGVMLLIHMSIPASEMHIEPQRSPPSDIICIDVVLGGVKFCVVIAYRPPRKNIDHRTDCNFLCNYLSSCILRRKKSIPVGKF